MYRVEGSGAGWRTADRSSIGLLPPASQSPRAAVRVFAAQTVRWRGIFATHCWIVFKPEGAASYTRYDYTAWGDPIRMNGFEPDGRWFGRAPEVMFAADGPEPPPHSSRGCRRPSRTTRSTTRATTAHGRGPNSNTFVAAVMDAVPESGCQPAAHGDRQGLPV